MLVIASIVTILAAAEASLSALPAVYIVCLIVGGGLLLVSLLAGGGSEHAANADLTGDMGGDVAIAPDAGMDVGHDFGGHGDLDAGHAADLGSADGQAAVADHASSSALSLASWFSVQFVVYALAVFGLIGTTLTYLTSVPPFTVLVVAAAVGLLLGQGVHQAMRALKRSGISSEITSRDFLHQPARVSVPIDPGRRGEVAVALRGGERFVAAVARRPDDRFRTGDRVIVVGFQAGVAVVTTREEFAFVTGQSTE